MTLLAFFVGIFIGFFCALTIIVGISKRNRNCKTCDFNKAEEWMFIKDFCTIMECQVTPKLYNFCKYYKSKKTNT